MNPIANLPATQNLNKAQQSQGYNRQYFGGDEVDEVVLSNQEEQKKKKAWTIGLTTLGTIALAVGAFVGLSATGCTKKGADNLKGFTQLTQGEGESATKLATIAKTDKSWTGATWGGVAETIKTTLDDSKTFGTIVIVTTKENKKKLEDKLGKEFINKHNSNLIFRAEDDIKNVAKQYGNDEKTLILVDSSKDNWFDEIEKEITSLNKPKDATTGEAVEEKKGTPSTTGGVGEESANASAPKTEQYFNIELNSLKSAQQISEELQKAIGEASDKIESFGPIDTSKPDEFINKKTSKFKQQYENAKEFMKAADALHAYCANKTKELEQDNAELNEKLKNEFSDEKKEEKLKQCTDDNKTKIVNEFDEQKKNIENKITANNKALANLKSISSYKYTETSFFETFHDNMKTIQNSYIPLTIPNFQITYILEQRETLKSEIIKLEETSKKNQETLTSLQQQQQEQGNKELTTQIESLNKTIAKNNTDLTDKKKELEDNKKRLEKTKNALTNLFETFKEIKTEMKSKEQQENETKEQKAFKNSISEKPVNEDFLSTTPHSLPSSLFSEEDASGDE